MTTNQSPSLNDAVAQLRAAAGDDRRTQAVIDWAESGQRAFLRTLGLTYRDSADENLRRVAQAATDFVEHDTRPPQYDAATVLLNLSNGAYHNGARLKALDYLNQALVKRPDWRVHPVIRDYAAVHNGGVAKARDTLKPLAYTPPEQDMWLTTAIWLGGYALLFAVGTSIVVAIISNTLSALRSAPSVNPRLLVVTLFTWMSEHQLMLMLAVALFVVADVLVRSGALHFGATQKLTGLTPAYSALVRKMVQLQAIFVAGGTGGILFLNYLSSHVRAGGGLSALSLLWQFGVAAGYILFLTRHLASTYSLSTGKALALILGASVVVSVVEYAILSLVFSTLL